MKKTKRGLELIDTGLSGDTDRLCLAVETAIDALSKELQNEIDRGNDKGTATCMRRIGAITGLLHWAHHVHINYKDHPAVLIAVPKYARHIDEWSEWLGPVWWTGDPKDRPHVGTPHDKHFDRAYKWWTLIDTPEIPESETHE